MKPSKMTFGKFILLFILMLVDVAPLLGQVEVQYAAGMAPRGLEEVWNVRVLNLGTEVLPVRLDVAVRDRKGDLVYKARSREILLPPGASVLQQNLVLPIETIRDVGNGAGLPPGRYDFEVSVLPRGSLVPMVTSVESGEIMRKNPMREQVVGVLKPASEKVKAGIPVDSSGTNPLLQVVPGMPALALPKEPGKVGKYFKVGGTARISGQYSDRQGTLQQTPPNYLRAEIDPTLRIGAIPLGMRVLLSTEHRPEHPINQVSFYFDANQFRQGLYDKTLGNIGKLEQLGDPGQMAQLGELKDKLLKRKFGDLDAMRAQLVDPDLRGGLAQLSTLEPLQMAMNHPRFAQGRRELDSLQGVYQIMSEEDLVARCDSLPAETCQKMMRLYNLQKDYEKLQTRVDDIQAKKKQLEKYADMAEKLRQADQVNMGALLAEPGNLRKTMRTMGLQTLPDQLAGTIRTLSIGTAYPFFSPLTLNGVRVDGMLVELNPAILYVAYTRGVVDRANLDTTAAVPRFQRVLQAGKVGFGKPEGSHAFVSMTHILDKGQSLIYSDAPNFNPQENLVIGTDLQLSLFKHNFTVTATGGGAAHNWNALAPAMDAETKDSLLGDLKKYERQLNMLPFTLNMTTHGDYAYQLGTQIRLFKQNTLLSGNYRYVGAGYVALGVPTLVNDRLQYEGRVDQQLLHKQVRLSGYFRRNHDLLIPGKPLKTEYLSYGGILHLQPRKMPFLRVQYAPYFQDAAATNYFMKSHLVNVMAGYNFSYKKVMFTTTLGVLDQQSGSNRADIRFSNRMYTVSQALTLPAGLTFNFNGSLVAPQITATDTTRIVSADLSVAMRVLKVVQNVAGAQVYAMDPNGSGQGAQGRRMGFYWNLSFPISRWARFELRVQRNLFDAMGAVGSGSYREIVGRGVLSVRL